MSRPLRVLVLPFALSLLAPACAAPGQVGDGDGLGDGEGDGDGSGDGDGDGAGDGDGEGDCEQLEAIEFAPGDPPDVMLVVDRSGSMEDELDNGEQKWPVMRDALEAVVNTYEMGVRFGLMMFPADDECGAGAVFSGVAMQNAASINGQLGATGPGGGTPTHTSMAAARSYYAGVAAGPGQRYVLLATDGEPNCGDINDSEAPTVTESIDAIETLTADGIMTFVLGFGGDVNTYPETLQAMAAAGGTGDYFAANSPDELSQALDAIAAEVGLPSCSFRLDSTPEDASAIAVSQDGVPVSQDPSHMNGWDYDPATNTVSFYGEACEAIRQGEASEVRIGLGCVGGVVD